MSADAEFKQFIDRILRCREAEDAAKDDTKEVYAELKALGYDKTAAGALVSELRKREKNPDQFAERETVLDLYRDAYQRASGMRLAPRVHTHEAADDRAARAKRRMSESMADHKDFSAELAEAGLISAEAHAENVAIADGMARKFGNGTAPHSSAPTSSPETTDESPAPRPNPAPGSPSPSAMSARTKADVMRLLRPHCQHPDDTEKCGGQGTKHCQACIKAAAEAAA